MRGSEEAVGGGSWYASIRRLSGTPVAAARRAVWPGDADSGLSDIRSRVAATSSAGSRVVIKRSLLSRCGDRESMFDDIKKQGVKRTGTSLTEPLALAAWASIHTHTNRHDRAYSSQCNAHRARLQPRSLRSVQTERTHRWLRSRAFLRLGRWWDIIPRNYIQPTLNAAFPNQTRARLLLECRRCGTRRPLDGRSRPTRDDERIRHVGDVVRAIERRRKRWFGFRAGAMASRCLRWVRHGFNRIQSQEDFESDVQVNFTRPCRDRVYSHATHHAAPRRG